MFYTISKSISGLSEELCKNEKIEKFASGSAAALVGTATTMVTGNPIAGSAASAVTGGLSKVNSKAVAETVTGAGIAVATCAVSLALTPVVVVGLPVFLIYNALKGE